MFVLQIVQQMSPNLLPPRCLLLLMSNVQSTDQTMKDKVDSIMRTVYGGFTTLRKCENCAQTINCGSGIEHTHQIMATKLGDDGEKQECKSIKECLEVSFGEEKIRYRCENCNNSTNQSKVLKLFSIPPLALFQVRRFESEEKGKKSVRVNHAITVDETISMNKYRLNREERTEFVKLVQSKRKELKRAHEVALREAIEKNDLGSVATLIARQDMQRVDLDRQLALLLHEDEENKEMGDDEEYALAAVVMHQVRFPF
jgi:hypothetical protein